MPKNYLGPQAVPQCRWQRDSAKALRSTWEMLSSPAATKTALWVNMGMVTQGPWRLQDPQERRGGWEQLDNRSCGTPRARSPGMTQGYPEQRWRAGCLDLLSVS